MRSLSNSDSMLVADCQTRLAVREADELRRVISGQLTGNPYLCPEGSVTTQARTVIRPTQL